MEESLVGRLRTVLARKPEGAPASAEPPKPDRLAVIASDEIARLSTRETNSDADQLVAIEFRALVPNEAAAREIAEVSRRGSDCADAVASASGRGDLSWQVLITLNMLPKPETIRDNVELIALFSSRFGGRADGWQMRERGHLT